MKLVAVVALFVAVLSFGTSVAAQCSDIPSCVGESAENKERVRAWLRETVVAARETEEARPTSTPRPTATPTTTQTPRATVTAQPTATSLPTVTPVPSVTPQPTATSPNLNATAMSIVINAVQPSKPTPVVLSEEEIVRRQTIGNAVIAGMLLMIAGGIYFFYRVITAKHEIEL